MILLKQILFKKIYIFQNDVYKNAKIKLISHRALLFFIFFIYIMI